MKHIALISVIFASVALGACGDDSSTADSRAGRTEANATGEPRIRVPEGPPPKKLVVNVLREGSGPPADEGKDEILVRYVGAYYDSGRVFFNSWDTGGPSKFLLEEVHRGWELGLKGMREGGRRELIEPSRLAYGAGAAIYVIDLVGVNRGSS